MRLQHSLMTKGIDLEMESDLESEFSVHNRSRWRLTVARHNSLIDLDWLRCVPDVIL